MRPPPGTLDRANRLIHEKSPYLLQHAHNPVDWHPWGDEAFARAREEGKPIFLSIGYSTCHWCHVMERESFENEAVAAILNRDYVPVKVDREERPDVDRIYMTAMQAIGLGGGWPLNVFLTPDLKPFYGGTYFTPGTDPSRPGLIQLLAHVREAWDQRRDAIESDGSQVLEALASFDVAPEIATDLEPLLERCYQELARVHDAERGGFGHAPKFPSVANLDFLIRFWARDPKAKGEALEMVRRQLDAMQSGGVHDQLGGGFHRYSTDPVWLVPHFEKMLYDQALLARAYLEAHQATGDPSYADTARGILRYVMRDLTSPEGAFFSAEDADSEGEEGTFYVWTIAQVEEVVGARDAALVVTRYGMTPEGNFEGANILSRARTIPEVAAATGLDETEVGARLRAAEETLLAARARRIRPHRDDKVIAAWNGLMISAFALAARILKDDEVASREYAARATRAAEFVWARLRDPQTGALRRRWREGEPAGPGQLDDHADLAFGFLELYGATFEPRWLDRARTLADLLVARFADREHGGFFGSPPDDPSIRIRMKEGYDGAELAGASIATWVLQALGTLLDRDDWRTEAKRSADYYARRLANGPSSMPRMLAAMDLAAATPRHVVVAGEPEGPETKALVRTFDRAFRPHDLLLLVDGARREELAALAPFVRPLTERDGKATAYVCVAHSCRQPTTDVERFAAQLDEAAASGTRGR